jgi:hypothetical protein
MIGIASPVSQFQVGRALQSTARLEPLIRPGLSVTICIVQPLFAVSVAAACLRSPRRVLAKARL